MFIPDDVRSQLQSLELQASTARPPKLVHPTMVFQLYATSARQDWDNMAQCLQDVLVKTGWLKNDNLKSCNGMKIIPPARIGRSEGAVVLLLESGEPLADLAVFASALAL